MSCSGWGSISETREMFVYTVLSCTGLARVGDYNGVTHFCVLSLWIFCPVFGSEKTLAWGSNG